MNLISQAELDRIERCLESLLPTASGAEGLAFFEEALRAFVMSGGKRVRPQLCLWTLQRGGGGDAQINAAALRIACAWELFHAFLLVHDDLIDQAETRRELPSLHRHFQQLGEVRPKIGRDLAIVAGDLLYGAAMGAFHDVDLPPDLYRRQLRLFSRVSVTTGLGQAIDIVQAETPLDRTSERALLREYHWKTAAYTFEGPMLSGAILAGADDAVIAAISRFALSLGQAYQLQNDLIDLATPAHEGCDLAQGKRTVTLMRGRESMTAAQREAFDARLESLPRAHGGAVALAEELRLELLRVGAPQRTRQLIEEFLDEARGAACDPVLPATLRDGLGGLLAQLNRQYFSGAQELARDQR